MWTVEPEAIWKKHRVPGISGFMRLKNEAEFVDRAIRTHIMGLDELIIVHNDCSDETPEICARWAYRYPNKIKVFEYKPKVVPIGTPESLMIDPRSPNCIANYYNFALSLTNRQIVIKIDGDHHAVETRFTKICRWVSKNLPTNRHYPIYGINITIDDHSEIVVYNYYDFSPSFLGDRAAKKGPPPFTSGDQAFYHVDQTCWHTVDPVEGFEVMPLKMRFEKAPFTYAYFHLKGMKKDRGTSNWAIVDGQIHLRAEWARNVLSPSRVHLASLEAMRRHNPGYFRGACVASELRSAFPELHVRKPIHDRLPAIGIRERLTGVWYRIAYM